MNVCKSVLDGVIHGSIWFLTLGLEYVIYSTKDRGCYIGSVKYKGRQSEGEEAFP